MSVSLNTTETQATVVQFNYDVVAPEHRGRLQQLAAEGLIRVRRTTEELSALYDILTEARPLVPYGYWKTWLQAELGIGSVQHAWNIMHPKLTQPEISNNLDLPQIGKSSMSFMFEKDDDEPDDENNHSNGSYGLPSERIVPGVVTSPEAYKPEPIQHGNGQRREAKQEYNHKSPLEKAKAMASAKPVVTDAPMLQAILIDKPEIERKDYIGYEFLVDHIGDLIEQAKKKGLAQGLQEMFYTRGFTPRKTTV
jgi:hypothetical protein